MVSSQVVVMVVIAYAIVLEDKPETDQAVDDGVCEPFYSNLPRIELPQFVDSITFGGYQVGS